MIGVIFEYSQQELGRPSFLGSDRNVAVDDHRVDATRRSEVKVDEGVFEALTQQGQALFIEAVRFFKGDRADEGVDTGDYLVQVVVA